MSNIDRAERRRQERAAAKSEQAPRLPYMEALAAPSEWIKRQTPEIQRAHRYEPATEITLYGPANHGRTLGMLDTGAHSTAIPQEWAQGLGVDLAKAERITAWANGVLAEYFIPVEPLRLGIAGRVIDLVMPTFGPWPEVLLGRIDVFRHFRVLIDERAQEFVLDPYDDPE